MSDEYERRLDEAVTGVGRRQEQARAEELREQEELRRKADRLRAAVAAWNDGLEARVEMAVRIANSRVNSAGLSLSVRQQPLRQVVFPGLVPVAGLPSLRVFAERGQRREALAIDLDENGMIAVGDAESPELIEPAAFDMDKVKDVIATLVERMLAMFRDLVEFANLPKADELRRRQR